MSDTAWLLFHLLPGGGNRGPSVGESALQVALLVLQARSSGSPCPRGCRSSEARGASFSWVNRKSRKVLPRGCALLPLEKRVECLEGEQSRRSHPLLTKFKLQPTPGGPPSPGPATYMLCVYRQLASCLWSHSSFPPSQALGGPDSSTGCPAFRTDRKERTNVTEFFQHLGSGSALLQVAHLLPQGGSHLLRAWEP